MKKIQTNKKNISIYIHIPFCESKCFYCDFCSLKANSNLIEKYFKYLDLEIDSYRDFLKDKIITSIFFGGGTPSSVDSIYILKILKKIKSFFKISNTCEITIESNPNSITEKKIIDYLNGGINRFSVGAQSFNNSILKTIGRIHNVDNIYKSIALLKSFNIKNINLDLMLALPNQKIDDIKHSIECIKELNPTHISYYSLILEDNTPLKILHDKSNLNFPDEILDRQMYHYVKYTLDKINYRQYEISNFSKVGYESIHNLNYWKLNNYIGLGLSSHSNIDNLRFYNHSDFNKYFSSIERKSVPIEEFEELNLKDRINEFTIMGLRLNSGINVNEVKNRFNIDFLDYYKSEIEKNIKNELISFKNETITLTDKGLDLSNQVEVDFIKL